MAQNEIGETAQIRLALKVIWRIFNYILNTTESHWPEESHYLFTFSKTLWLLCKIQWQAKLQEVVNWLADRRSSPEKWHRTMSFGEGGEWVKLCAKLPSWFLKVTLYSCLPHPVIQLVISSCHVYLPHTLNSIVSSTTSNPAPLAYAYLCVTTPGANTGGTGCLSTTQTCPPIKASMTFIKLLPLSGHPSWACQHQKDKLGTPRCVKTSTLRIPLVFHSVSNLSSPKYTVCHSC